MSLVQRKIAVAIALNNPPAPAPPTNPTFDGSNNTLSLSNLRADVTVNLNGGPAFSTADIRILGMTRDHMNSASSLGKPLMFFKRNSITVTAGDDQAGMSTVFAGTYQIAYQDLTSAPEVAFIIQGIGGQTAAMKPVAPSSYAGRVDVSTIFSSLAQTIGVRFENTGVSGVFVTNPYLPGTAREQVKALAKAANVNFLIDGDSPSGTLAIWPRTGSRGGQVPEIGPTTGLIGYPQYADGGIAIRTLFNPNLKMGGKFNLTTSVTPAAGSWIIRSLTHRLQSQTPGGDWYTIVGAYRASNLNQ